LAKESVIIKDKERLQSLPKIVEKKMIHFEIYESSSEEECSVDQDSDVDPRSKEHQENEIKNQQRREKRKKQRDAFLKRQTKEHRKIIYEQHRRN
jgi:hypothetical protein